MIRLVRLPLVMLLQMAFLVSAQAVALFSFALRSYHAVKCGMPFENLFGIVGEAAHWS